MSGTICVAVIVTGTLMALHVVEMIIVGAPFCISKETAIGSEASQRTVPETSTSPWDSNVTHPSGARALLEQDCSVLVGGILARGVGVGFTVAQPATVKAAATARTPLAMY
ncbi:hypothetical protein [Agreia sp. COWG]|uniref:hypothetical protein n=1 Tax=Agreia sp. COWG TaxID=2773266 RepID=UPI0019262BD6|nr:hypothetical protein [Agreia sp. COWG]